MAYFRKYCYICNLIQHQSQPRLKSIVPTEIFERVKIDLDLVDMRNCTGHEKWIAHMENHNSHNHALWPQKNKAGIFSFFSIYFY